MRADPIVAKALRVCHYLTLDDLKNTTRLYLAKVLQRHAEQVMAGLPLTGPEVKAKMDQINAESELATDAAARIEELTGGTSE